MSLTAVATLQAIAQRRHLLAAELAPDFNPLFDTKLGVKFVLGGMAHETAHEGPCRLGRLEDLSFEAEAHAFDRQVKDFVEHIRKRSFVAEAEILEPVGFRMLVRERDVEFKFPEPYFALVAEDMPRTDLIVVIGGFASDIALRLAERFHKPVATIGNTWVVDVPATLRHQGHESFIAHDWDDFNHLVRLLWVRQAFSRTKLLVVTDRPGEAPFGLASAIHDFADLQRRYGLQHHRISNQELTAAMDGRIGTAAGQEQAQALTHQLVQNAQAVHMSEENIRSSVYFYQAIKDLMDQHACNAFTIECREVCPLEIAARYRFTPCLAMSLLKDAGYPTVCQTDINALIPMMALSYFGRRSVYMGNPEFRVKQNIFTLHHDVPGLKMAGFERASLPYELRNFTVGGWGVTLRYDFSRDPGQVVTLARANPGQSKILLTKGEIIDGFGFDQIGCSLGVRMKVADTLSFFRHAADYGGHFVMAYGDYLEPMRELSQLMNFEALIV